MDSDEDHSMEYSDGDDCYQSDQSYMEEDEDLSYEAEGETASAPQQTYVVLTEDDIRQRQEEDIQLVASTLSLHPSSATILLCHNKWQVDTVTEAWFSNETEIRNKVGLTGKASDVTESSSLKKVKCGICFDHYRPGSMSAAACGHRFCNECWGGYLRCSINDGLGCLTLRCPQPSCRSAVDRTMIEKLVSADEGAKYARHLLRSYVEGRNNMKIKWCPSPGCEYAVKLIDSDSYDVDCRCSYRFCWGCSEEAHRPVNCDIVAKWIEKNKSDAENTDWVLANTKPCPKCKKPIEKNQGCMHMTCAQPCGFHFCWLCLRPWSEHGTKTGGFYDCNRYRKGRQEGMFSEEEMKRQAAKESVSKYTHYYERWIGNNSSMVKAKVTLKELENGGLAEMQSKLFGESMQGLKFITDAWTQIAEGRRVLKWSYAYGYYVPDYQKTKKELFEELQGQAESQLERLHKCAEEDLTECYNATTDGSMSNRSRFNDYRVRLTELTSPTRMNFENLVRAFESGLEEVFCEEETSDNEAKNWYCEKCSSANTMASTRCANCEPVGEDPEEGEDEY